MAPGGHEHAPRGLAPLAVEHQLAAHELARGVLEIGVVEHDRRVAGAQLELQRRHPLDRGAGDGAAARARARVADQPDAGVGRELLAHARVTGDDLGRPLRQLGLQQRVDQQLGRQRRVLGRLQQRGTARGQRVGELGHRQIRRRIPGGQQRGRPPREAQALDAAPVPAEVLGRQRARGGRGDLLHQAGEAAGEQARGVDRDAELLCVGERECVDTAVESGREAQQGGASLLRREAAPGARPVSPMRGSPRRAPARRQRSCSPAGRAAPARCWGPRPSPMPLRACVKRPRRAGRRAAGASR